MVDQSIIDGFIRAQAQIVPATIVAVRQRLRELTLPRAGHIVLVGSGTSLNALMVAKPALEASGAFVEVLNPGAFLQREPVLGRETLVVALSQTGTSETTVAAVRRAQDSGLTTLTITAEADSPIGQMAAAKIVMPIGPGTGWPEDQGLWRLAGGAGRVGGGARRARW
ncbi:SIS domain-containing protein [Bosea vestrisii]|uniref:SIS domain-containing protein n=1 Tax=Bosea vestrisii TaxID=151416 RepID=UPI0024DFACEE|nr:SIS domain-containing protein [Bosea vestrisii]WID98477.1 SIS domain-containing protein [Bosea vestrisii]